MKVTYRRDFNHSYMILSDGNAFGSQEFQVRMITENSIPGFLSCHIEWMNGRPMAYYDVTSRQSLKMLLDMKNADRGFLELLFLSLERAAESMQNYLLSQDGLVLSPETVFINAAQTEMYFCYFPGQEESFSEQLRSLSEFLLPKLDHNDQQAVVMGYAFYQQCGENGPAPGTLCALAEEFHPGITEERVQEPEPQREMREPGGTDEPPVPDDTFFPDEKEAEQKKGRGFLSRIFRKGKSKKQKTGKKPPDERKKKRKERKRRAEETDEGDPDIRAEIAPYLYEEEQETSAETGGEPGYDGMEETTFLGKQEMEGAGSGRSAHAVLIWERPAAQANGQVPTSEEQRFLLEKDHYVVGKNGLAADLVIPSPAVSRVHAMIQWRGNAYSLSDLNSRNGTKVGDHWLEGEEEVLLKDGDRILFANEAFRYEFVL